MPESSQTLEVALLIININGTRDVEVEGFKILIMIKVTKQPILVVAYGHTCSSLGCSYIAVRGANPPQWRMPVFLYFMCDALSVISADYQENRPVTTLCSRPVIETGYLWAKLGEISYLTMRTWPIICNVVLDKRKMETLPTIMVCCDITPSTTVIYNKPTRCNSGSIVFIENYKYALHVSDALCVHLQEHYKL